MATRLVEELRAKYPSMAKAAERRPRAAIRLFCLECLGGSFADVDRCSDVACPLWPFRRGPGKRPEPSGRYIDPSDEISTAGGPDPLRRPGTCPLRGVF